MKTFRQLIDELPEPVRSKALANTAPHEMDDTSSGQECPGFLVFAFDWFGAPEGWQYWRDACDGKFEQPAAPAPKNNLQELFNRLPEPWRSKAVSNCEEYYGAPLAEIRSSLDDSPGFEFLSEAFPWCATPEGEFVWRNISDNGVFPPEDEPEEETTHRISDLERRVSALEDRLAEPATCADDVAAEPEDPSALGEGYRLLERGETILEGDEWWVKNRNRWTPASVYPIKLYIDGRVRRKLAPAPQAYRLLNPGEIIRATDEGYLMRNRWIWEVMGDDDYAVGKPHDPTQFHPIRRPLKTYEDA